MDKTSAGALLIALPLLIAMQASLTSEAATSRVKMRAPAQASAEEAAPKPEPPYPGSEENEFASDPSMAKQDDEPAPIQRPVKIDEEGNYYYGTDVAAPTPSGRAGIAKPKGTDKDGGFIYDTKPEKPRFSGRPGVERPVEMLASGEYRYRMQPSLARKSASFRLGVMTPPEITNPDNDVKYEDIYGKEPAPILLGDYEFLRLFSKAGRLGIKFGSGLIFANGRGRFKDPARAAELPDESYMFVVFPNTLTANYRFQFAQKQILVPFIEGGGGYYTFAEIRDDGKRPKFGGSLVGVAAGGFNFLLNWLDPAAVRSLDAEYGINHVWLTAEARATVGVNKTVDFTNTSFNAGFLMEF